jgi:hypothetical protein
VSWDQSVHLVVPHVTVIIAAIILVVFNNSEKANYETPTRRARRRRAMFLPAKAPTGPRTPLQKDDLFSVESRKLARRGESSNRHLHFPRPVFPARVNVSRGDVTSWRRLPAATARSTRNTGSRALVL